MRPHRFAIVLVAFALAASGCSADEGSGGGSDGALERLLGSTDATREAGTARMSQTLVMRFPDRAPADSSAPSVSSGSIEVVAEGYLDLRSRRGRLDVNTSGTGIAGADALGGDMRMILDGRAMYMKSPFYQQLAPNHEPWLRVSFEELGLRGMSQLGQQDPLAFVEALRGVYGDVRELGREEVREQTATRYHATIDVERLIAKLPAGTRTTVETSFSQLGIDRLPIDAWLDEEGRLVRMTSDVKLEGETTAGGEMQMSLELYDFGVAFDLHIPPDDQVAEFGDVFGRAEG